MFLRVNTVRRESKTYRYALLVESYRRDIDKGVKKSIAKAMDKHLDSKKALILDLGCGTGLVGEALKELDYPHVDGVDFSNTD